MSWTPHPDHIKPHQYQSFSSAVSSNSNYALPREVSPRSQHHPRSVPNLDLSPSVHSRSMLNLNSGVSLIDQAYATTQNYQRSHRDKTQTIIQPGHYIPPQSISMMQARQETIQKEVKYEKKKSLIPNFENLEMDTDEFPGTTLKTPTYYGSQKDNMPMMSPKVKTLSEIKDYHSGNTPVHSMTSIKNNNNNSFVQERLHSHPNETILETIGSRIIEESSEEVTPTMSYQHLKYRNLGFYVDM